MTPTGSKPAMLDAFTRLHDLGRVYPGPIDVLFAQGDYLAPDLVFVHKDRLSIISKRGLEAAPDLVVEVLSESTASRDRLLKKRRYAHFGVPEYWIVDPTAKQVEVYRFAERPDHGDVFDVTFEWRPAAGGPVLEVDVPDLFDEIG